MIDLTPLDREFPTFVTKQEYEKLIRLSKNGWSHADTDKEWLAKLHYTRTGFKEKKLSKEKFAEIEKNLVLNWWSRWV